MSISRTFHDRAARVLRGSLLLPLAFATLLSVPAWSAPKAVDEGELLVASADQASITGAIVERLSRTHYVTGIELDDDFSSSMLDRYLTWLDPSRLFFLAADIAEFEEYREELDDSLRSGDLSPAYSIFNRLQQRRHERMVFLLGAVDNKIDTLEFNKGGTLELDRAESPWPEGIAEADELWFKRFKNEVLSLRLADREVEDIAEVLLRRYSNQQRRIEQATSEDVFRIFVNVFARSYDPHTEYYPPLDAENFDITMKLSFEGIGALLGNDGEYCRVERIIPGGPAEADGQLMATDRIVAVAQDDDGEMVDVVGWRNDEIVELIRGPKDTKVRLMVLGANQSDISSAKELPLTRGQVKLESQAAKSKTVEIERDGQPYTVGVIELPAFYMDFEAARSGDPNFKSATRDVALLVSELEDQGIDGLVMDLRNNGGGSLIEAQELTSMFVGATPVVQIRGGGNDVDVVRSSALAPAYTGPLVVLVNRLSASASEIFSAAVQDTGRGVVVGERTFGKGTVQGMMPLGEGQLKVTQAKFYRISGGSTQNRGVRPDVKFPRTYDHAEIGESALEEALEWDRIPGIRHPKGLAVDELEDSLQQLHDVRLGKDPELAYLVQRLDLYDELGADTEISLDEEMRKDEQELVEARYLAIENSRRTAQGDELLETLEDWEAPDVDRDVDVDTLGREAARVLVDFILEKSKMPKPESFVQMGR
ncbi:MAG: carboxyl-terminal processing protease [Pseudohongiellaceae bacterium]|jgi:carboxyl-terminal processing protease